MLLTLLAKVINKSFPESYYVKPTEEKTPKAPPWVLRRSYSFELAALFIVFGIFIQYFASIGTPVVTISGNLLPGQDCVALNPKQGTTYYSNTTSENAQFARPNMTVQQCEDRLQQSNVCGDGVRLDFLQILGVTNFNNSQYFSSGYFSFTPSTAAGLKAGLAQLYNPSTSFPKPDITTGVTFKVSSGWNLFDANTGSSGTFSAYSNLPSASTYLYDAEKTNVYTPVTDFDLSGTSAKTSDSILQSKVLTNTRYKKRMSAAMHNGIAYGLETETYIGRAEGVSVDSTGKYLYVADTENSYVRRVDLSTGIVSNIGTSADPPFNSPKGVSVDSSGQFVYVADFGNFLIRCIDLASGIVTNVGTSANPPIKKAEGLQLDSTGRYLYVADTDNSLVRQIDLITGSVSDVGTSANPSFLWPQAVTVDNSSQYLYVADYGNALVRRVDLVTGDVTDVGAPNNTLFLSPQGLFVDSKGEYLYVTLYDSRVIKRVDLASGTVSGVAAMGKPAFSRSQGMSIDSNGKFMYVADAGNNMIRRFDLSSGTLSGLGASASPPFNRPQSLSVDREGQYLYVGDSDNNLVRQIDLTTGNVSNIATLAIPHFNNAQGMSIDSSGQYLYVADSENSLVRRIDLASGTVTDIDVSGPTVW